MKLLVDGTAPVSPGMRAIQQQLIAALERTATGDDRVHILLKPGDEYSPRASTTELERAGPPRWSWLQHWRWSKMDLPRLVRQIGADAVYTFGFVSRRLTREAPAIATVNNMLPFTPAATEQLSWLGRLRLRLLKREYIATLTRADQVVLHSSHARDILAAHVPRLERKTNVALTGSPRPAGGQSPASLPHPYNGRPYFLYLSAIYGYKNHVTLVHGYAEALKKRPDLPDLLLAGFASEDDPVLRRIETLIEDLGLQDRVRYIGAVPAETKWAWLYHAQVNWFPSLVETNSVVLAEILEVGGILAASNRPPMPEVAADAAAYFDPEDAESIAALMITLSEDADLRRSLKERSVRRAKDLSWDACGETIWAAARAAATSNNGGNTT